MYDLEFEYETARINLCFKIIGLRECTEVLGGEIGLQECADGKSPEQNTIIMNQHVEECSRLGLIRRIWIFWITSERLTSSVIALVLRTLSE